MSKYANPRCIIKFINFASAIFRASRKMIAAPSSGATRSKRKVAA